MRFVRVSMKVVAMAMLLATAGALTASAGPKPPRPNGSDCQQACYDQFLADRQECDQRLAARLSELDAEEAACRENAKDPITLGRCLNRVNIKRRVAANDQRKCYSRANTKAFNCYRQCNASETAP
ncbi:MAG: hypothetical protein U0V87_17935 [Acidobacteriota bacterium]